MFKVRNVSRNLALVSLLLQSFAVNAQSTAVQVTPGDASQSSNKATISDEKTPVVTGEVERVEVTGSHIKRIEKETISPVQVINRKSLEKSGYNSVSDVLRDTTANSFGSVREDSGSNAAGVAHVNLRGLGSSNTLVLLNGQRLPTDAVTGAVDLNLIPMAAVERIEVLKDGASATYGSDALGGVVNVITRKNFSGTEVGYKQTTPSLTGGKREEVSLVNGVNRGKLNMINVVNYRKNEVVQSKDRDWSNNGYSMIGSPGSYRNASGTWIADSNCPAGDVVSSPSGNVCRFKHTDYSTELPDLEQVSMMTEANYKLSAKTKMKARMGGTQKNIKWSYAPAPGTFTIKGNVADTLGPGGTPLPGVTPGEDLQVRYRLKSLGTRDTEVKTNAFNVMLGSTTMIGSAWSLDTTVAHNRVNNEDKGVNGYALTSKLTQAIENGVFNPFDPNSDTSALNAARYEPLEKTMSELSSFEVKATGEIAEMEAGAVGMAIGATAFAQEYRDEFDERSVKGEVFGNAGSSGGGKRNVEAVFTEVSVPLTKKLEAQLAARYDNYSDFGDTVNPKVGFLYRATPKLLWRGSAGTGFKAPLMQDLYAATSNGFPTAIDAVACNKEKQLGGATPSCTPQQYQVTSSGNTGLKEEKSLSYNTGIVFEPNPDFNIGADLFLTKLDNVVGISYSDALLAESKGIDLKKYGVIVTRDANGYIDNIVAPMQNLSAQEISGLDLSTAVQVSKVRLSVEHSRLFYFKEEGFPGSGFKDKLGENGLPVWRTVSEISYAPGLRHDISVAAITIGGHEKAVKEEGDLPSYTSVDLMYTYSNKKLGVLTAGVKNLLGTTPPLDDSNPTQQLNVSLYDQIGKQFVTSYKASF